MIYLVLVQYGERQNSGVERLESFINLKFGCEVVLLKVRTDIDSKFNRIKNINECMEFSGYQEGLLRCLEMVRANNIFGWQKIQIIFINDTFFSGHLFIYGSFIIKKAIEARKFFDDNCVLGIWKNKPAQIYIENTTDKYFTTWIFSIFADVRVLEKISFYSSNACGANFFINVWPNVLPLYRSQVDLWLKPKAFMKGWYKSVPGIDLPVHELNRKIVSIYSEHMLFEKLKNIGLQACDIGGGSNGFYFYFLAFCDRVYINYLKFGFRLKFKLKKFIT